jgi:2-succinyl-6-hydroxy-2,4-cyclohexadiene-1-carboxylate synthase
VAHPAASELFDEGLERGEGAVERDHSGVAGPVVFVPGFMQRGGAWKQVAATVRERYPSVLLDHREHTFDARVEELLAAVPSGAVAVGYSFGARVVLHAALREPSHFAALALVGATAGIEDRAERRREDEELAGWIERTPIEEVVERWEALPVFATQSTDVVRAQRAGRVSHDPAELATLLRTGGQGAVEPVWDRLGELKLPVLCMAGELDERDRGEARRIAELLPRGSVELVERAGHAPQLERPEQTARALLDFFERELNPL